MDGTSDGELAQRACQGDQAAFGLLVRRYQNAVFDMACRMLRDRDAALDAAQEVFIKAHRSLDRYDDARKFSTWLLAITRNHCIDQLRRPAHRLAAPLPDESRVPAERRQEPDRVAERTEQAHLVERAVAELGDSYREAVELYHYHDLSYAEAAEVQGVPLGTFMARLHRARRQLRDRLRTHLGVGDAEASDRVDHRKVG